MNRKVLLVLSVLCLLLAPVMTLGGDVPLGLRGGYTNWENVTQIHLGAHAKIADLFPYWDLVPNVEFGFGDNLTVVTLNGDLVYRFTELFSNPWCMYAGGELGLNIVDHEYADSNSDLGLSGLAGLTYDLDNGNQWLMELKFGILDSPGFKLTFGYSFF